MGLVPRSLSCTKVVVGLQRGSSFYRNIGRTMSYILDTLKKLEKEKTGIEKKINLNELVIKDDSEAYLIKILKRKNLLLTLLASVSALFFFLNFPDFNFSNIKPVAENKKNTSSAINTFNAPMLDKRTELLSIKAEGNAEISNNSKRLFESNNLSDEKLDQRLDHIEQLIQEKYLPEVLKKLDDSDKKNKILTNNPQKIIAGDTLPPDIRDLNLKGIIFFGQDNPLNYVLADYNGEKQIKLKAGDHLLNGIEVLDIRAEKIILIFQDKIFEKGMGS